MSDSVKEQIDLLAAFPEQLKRQLQGLEDAALRFRPAPDEWSIMELVGHIIDVGTLWPGRTRQMLATDNPTLAAVDPNWVRQRLVLPTGSQNTYDTLPRDTLISALGLSLSVSASIGLPSNSSTNLKRPFGGRGLPGSPPRPMRVAATRPTLLAG